MWFQQQNKAKFALRQEQIKGKYRRIVGRLAKLFEEVTVFEHLQKCLKRGRRSARTQRLVIKANV